jgi:hypothetical protein
MMQRKFETMNFGNDTWKRSVFLQKQMASERAALECRQMCPKPCAEFPEICERVQIDSTSWNSHIPYLGTTGPEAFHETTLLLQIQAIGCAIACVAYLCELLIVRFKRRENGARYRTRWCFFFRTDRFYGKRYRLPV